MDNIGTLTDTKGRRIPKYVKLAEKLRNDIMGGKFKPGESVPSQEELVNKYKMALATVRQAVGVLQNEGLLKSIHGKGNYVQNATVSQAGAVNLPYTYKIGFLFAGMSLESHYNHLLQFEIQKHTHNSNIDVVFDTYFTGREGEDRHIAEWSKNLNGVILTGYIDEKLLMLLRKNVKHILVIGGTISENKECSFSKICQHFEAIMSQAVSFLAVLGHKRIIATACTDTTLPIICEEFQKGFLTVVENLNLRGEMKEYTTDSMVECVNDIVTMSEKPTAIISLGTEHSYRFMTQLLIKGIKVPDDISIMAVGEKRLVQGCKPVLTCIGDSAETIAKSAIEAIIEAIKTDVAMHQKFPGVLSLGETCIPIKNDL